MVTISDDEITRALGGKTGDDAYDEAVSLVREKSELEAKLKAANQVRHCPHSSC
jgi:hypothetical protein